MIPFWIFTLGSLLPADDEVGKLVVPFIGILKSLAVILVPILVGVLIKYKLPRVAAVICKGLKVCTLISYYGSNHILYTTVN